MKRFGLLALVSMVYAVASGVLLIGGLWVSGRFGLPETLIAALAGALVGSAAPVITAGMTSLEQQRATEAHIRDESSRVALDLTKIDYDLRLRALRPGQTQAFLAPAKVYRELYKAILELRTKETWPKAVEDLGLLDTLRLPTPQSPNTHDSPA